MRPARHPSEAGSSLLLHEVVHGITDTAPATVLRRALPGPRGAVGAAPSRHAIIGKAGKQLLHVGLAAVGMHGRWQVPPALHAVLLLQHGSQQSLLRGARFAEPAAGFPLAAVRLPLCRLQAAIRRHPLPHHVSQGGRRRVPVARRGTAAVPAWGSFGPVRRCAVVSHVLAREVSTHARLPGSLLLLGGQPARPAFALPARSWRILARRAHRAAGGTAGVLAASFTAGHLLLAAPRAGFPLSAKV
mmetsp:Transcript_2863/g.8022  ORF Transcript_2863/g.8022 Transcript_2863/m.8022 type:complete len:245 (-) Transcript_2863:6222-6956(-)